MSVRVAKVIQLKTQLMVNKHHLPTHPGNLLKHFKFHTLKCVNCLNVKVKKEESRNCLEKQSFLQKKIVKDMCIKFPSHYIQRPNDKKNQS